MIKNRPYLLENTSYEFQYPVYDDNETFELTFQKLMNYKIKEIKK